jgi:hypothetical protein
MIVSVSPHNVCGETDTIMKTYVEKLTQSRKLMRRNWHNHENLCGETDTITKTYVHKFSRLCQFLHISFHDCVSFSTYVFMIVSISQHKFSWLCQFLHMTYVEQLTQSWKLMWRNWHNHENLCGETDTITKTYVEKLFSWLCQFLKTDFRDCVSFFT